MNRDNPDNVVALESSRLNLVYEAIDPPKIPELPLEIVTWSSWLSSHPLTESTESGDGKPGKGICVPPRLLQAPGPPRCFGSSSCFELTSCFETCESLRPLTA